MTRSAPPRRGCRTNHSEFQCLARPWDSPARRVRSGPRDGTARRNGADFARPLPPPSLAPRSAALRDSLHAEQHDGDDLAAVPLLDGSSSVLPLRAHAASRNRKPGLGLNGLVRLQARPIPVSEQTRARGVGARGAVRRPSATAAFEAGDSRPSARAIRPVSAKGPNAPPARFRSAPRCERRICEVAATTGGSSDVSGPFRDHFRRFDRVRG